MQLTPEDVDKLQTKELANVIRKLNAGKTLTAAERALLAQARAASAGAPSAFSPQPSAFVSTWDDLAQALGVSRKSVQNWRDRERAGDLPGPLPRPKADGRHEVAAWSKAMVDYGLARADEHADPDDVSDWSDERRTVTDWKKYREQLLCTQLERTIEKDDGKLLVATELEVPIGATFATIQTKLSQFPARVARYLRGLRDEQEIEERLREEIDADLSDLQSARYIETSVGEILAGLPEQPLPQNQPALLELVGRLAIDALRRIGQRALRVALKERDDSGEILADTITGQVTDEAAERSASARSRPDASTEKTSASAEQLRVPPEASPEKLAVSRGRKSGAAEVKKRKRRPRRQPTPPPPAIEATILPKPRNKKRRR